jgi:hypothetical protein
VPYALGGSVNLVGGDVWIMLTGVSSSVSNEALANDPDRDHKAGLTKTPNRSPANARLDKSPSAP